MGGVGAAAHVLGLRRLMPGIVRAARLEEREQLTESVVRLRLALPHPVTLRSGQYSRVEVAPQEWHDYAIARVPGGSSGPAPDGTGWITGHELDYVIDTVPPGDDRFLFMRKSNYGRGRTASACERRSNLNLRGGVLTVTTHSFRETELFGMHELVIQLDRAAQLLLELLGITYNDFLLLLAVHENPSCSQDEAASILTERAELIFDSLGSQRERFRAQLGVLLQALHSRTADAGEAE